MGEVLRAESVLLLRRQNAADMQSLALWLRSQMGEKERLLVSYLLGELSEEEQVRVEDHAFTDPSYLAEIEAAEADLIDTYVRGELPPDSLPGFERRFLRSPSRRSKLELAQALARVVVESKSPPR